MVPYSELLLSLVSGYGVAAFRGVTWDSVGRNVPSLMQ